MTRQPRADSRQPTAARRSFTLTELLAAMAIIAIIAAVTVVSVRTIARDAKLSSANNTITAALDTARGIAIRDNKLTVLVFRPRLDGNRQYVELVTAQWTGESPTISVSGMNSPQVVDRFLPVPGVAARRLPAGIKIGGPFYGSSENLDDVWLTPSHFPAQGEAEGRIIGVMFAGNGNVAMRNAANDSHRIFVDFNNDGAQQVGESAPMSFVDIDYNNNPPSLSQNEYNTFLFLHYAPEAEPFISLVPFLAVFDDDRCRDEYDASAWTAWQQREQDYSEYISNHADRIHFNRYTGVVMR